MINRVPRGMSSARRRPGRLLSSRCGFRQCSSFVRRLGGGGCCQAKYTPRDPLVELAGGLLAWRSSRSGVPWRGHRWGRGGVFSPTCLALARSRSRSRSRAHVVPTRSRGRGTLSCGHDSLARARSRRHANRRPPGSRVVWLFRRALRGIRGPRWVGDASVMMAGEWFGWSARFRRMRARCRGRWRRWSTLVPFASMEPAAVREKGGTNSPHH